MFARITSYKMKAGTKDAATDLMHSLKDEIMGLNGMCEFINVMDGSGKGYVISLLENEDISNANAEKVKAIWANFSDHIETVAPAEGYDVSAHWTG